MHEAHYHLHVEPVYRSKLQSAVASAAYQANQCLTHEGQRLCTVAIDHRKQLNKGIITDALRSELEEKILFQVAAEGLDLLAEGAAPIEQMKQIEKANKERPIIRQEELTDEMKQWKTLLARFEEAGEELSDRLRLWESNEGFTLRDKGYRQNYHLRMENGQMTVARYHGIELSEQATAQKEKRRLWTISDGKNQYTVREYEERAYDNTTKKQTCIGRYLDVYGNRTHDYRDKGDVVETWVRDSEHAPESIKALGSQRQAHQGQITQAERKAMWQTSEDLEKSRNGRPARKIEVAMLRELTYEQNRQALNAFIETHFTSKGIICDIAVHRKIASDGKPNEHAHILFFTREALPGGKFANTKDDYWNSDARVKEWREGWETVLNNALKDAGVKAFVNKDSYKKRRLDKEPGQHLGPEQWALEERNIKTAKGKKNRRKESHNTSRETAQSILLDRDGPLDDTIEATEMDDQLISLAAQDQSDPTSDEHLIGLAAHAKPDEASNDRQQGQTVGPAHVPTEHAVPQGGSAQEQARATIRASALAFAKTMLQRSVRASVRLATHIGQVAARVGNFDSARLQRNNREMIVRRAAADRAAYQQNRGFDYER